MKAIVLVIGLLTATLSQAATHLLHCAERSDRTGDVFTANFTPNHANTWLLQNAKVTGPNTYTTFKCKAGNSFKDMKCTGYWNENPSELIEVTFSEFVYPANYVNLRSVSTNEMKSWTCRWNTGF